MDKPTILIVDDEPINLSMLKNLLADRYQIRACKRGEEAVRAVNVEPRPDLVLLDIKQINDELGHPNGGGAGRCRRRALRREASGTGVYLNNDPQTASDGRRPNAR